MSHPVSLGSMPRCLGLPEHNHHQECVRAELTPGTETGIQVTPNLRGLVHPIFGDWIIPNDDDDALALSKELVQPLLLASRILQTVGLPWISEFFIDDVFQSSYPGRGISTSSKAGRSGPKQTSGELPLVQDTPEVIVRHHRAAWATPRMRSAWLASADYELRFNVPRHVQWQINGEIFSRFGWVGYTCRHRPRQPAGVATIPTPLLDRPEAVIAADEEARKLGATNRPVTVLVMKEYASRLRMLRWLGRLGGEEYLFTAFMAAVTVLHE